MAASCKVPSCKREQDDYGVHDPALTTATATCHTASVERREKYRRLQSAWERRVRWIQRGRVICFIAASVGFFSQLFLPSLTTIGSVVGGVLVVAFIFLVVLHRYANNRLRWYAILLEIVAEAEHRRGHDWDSLPLADVDPPPTAHPYAHDLDLCGRCSLMHLAFTPGTVVGRDTFRRWLLELPPHETTVARQEAVRELAPLVDLRDEVAARGRLADDVKPQSVSGFLEWTDSRPWLLHRRWLVWMSRAAPLSTLLLLTLQLTGVLSQPVWFLPLVTCFAIAAATWHRAGAIIARASLHPSSVLQLENLLELVARTPFGAELLRGLQMQLRRGESAGRQLRRLRLLVSLGQARYSELTHFLLNSLLLWDLHLVLALERWCQAAGPFAGGWFAALGDVEALCCLAELAHSHPAWAFPVVRQDSRAEFIAADLAHPLLPPDRCVANDVRVGPPGTFLFVTGSNMSGKSTLLRAIGLNSVLARVGGPVCATSMELGVTEISAYAHVRDSLFDGVSTFMAGLLRLKDLMERARRLTENGGTLLFLLDEPLQGTNPAERQVALRGILRSLLRLNAIGAIATHDLTLAQSHLLSPVAVAVHFDEQVRAHVGKTDLTFDYKLRPGVATSTNALRLMEAIGLSDLVASE